MDRKHEQIMRMIDEAADKALEEMTVKEAILMVDIAYGKVTKLPVKEPDIETKRRFAKLSQLGVITIYLDNTVKISNIGRAIINRSNRS